jgi:DNA-binding XRE family transcriptional regulator
MGFAKPTETALPRQGIASPGGDFPKRKVSESSLRELGNRLRQLRGERGFSQEGFAEVCGLHRTAIGLIERGKSSSRLDTLLMISQALDVPVSRLLSGIEQFQ